MNIHFEPISHSIKLPLRYRLSTQTYHSENRPGYEYIVCKPIGTECFIVCTPPNMFQFYHITTDVICDKIPFMTTYIPTVSLDSSVIFHGTILRSRLCVVRLCVVYDILFPNRSNKYIETNQQRLTTLYEWFTRNIQVYQNEIMVFGIPHILHVNAHTPECIDLSSVPYPIQHIEYKGYDDTIVPGSICHISKDLPHGSIPTPSVKMNVVRPYIFTATADLLPDIYHLTDDMGIYIGVAHIPDFTTSVFMNSIFRTIKENANLDLLEESDDESEFENTNIDKYVNMKKTVRVECVYNTKFMKWVPVKLSH